VGGGGGGCGVLARGLGFCFGCVLFLFGLKRPSLKVSPLLIRGKGIGFFPLKPCFSLPLRKTCGRSQKKQCNKENVIKEVRSPILAIWGAREKGHLRKLGAEGVPLSARGTMTGCREC